MKALTRVRFDSASRSPPTERSPRWRGLVNQSWRGNSGPASNSIPAAAATHADRKAARFRADHLVSSPRDGLATQLQAGLPARATAIQKSICMGWNFTIQSDDAGTSPATARRLPARFDRGDDLKRRRKGIETSDGSMAVGALNGIDELPSVLIGLSPKGEMRPLCVAETRGLCYCGYSSGTNPISTLPSMKAGPFHLPILRVHPGQ